MSVVVHAQTVLSTTFTVVDNDGNVSQSVPSNLKISALTEEDFATACKHQIEFKQNLEKEHNVTSPEAILSKIEDFRGQLEESNSNNNSNIEQLKKSILAIEQYLNSKEAENAKKNTVKKTNVRKKKATTRKKAAPK